MLTERTEFIVISKHSKVLCCRRFVAYGIYITGE